MILSWLSTLFSTAIIVLTGLFGSIILARGLGADGRGLLAIISMIVSIVAGLSQFGFGQGLLFKFNRNNKWDYNYYVALSTAIVFFASLIFSYLAANQEYRIGSDLKLICVMLCVSQSIYFLFLNLQQVQEKLKWYNIIRVLYPFSTFIVSIYLYSNGVLNVHNYLLIQLCSSIALIVVQAYILFYQFKMKAGNRFDEIIESDSLNFFTLSIKYYLNALFGLIMGNLDKVYFYLYGSLNAFGIYTIAYGISRIFGYVQESSATAIFSNYVGKKSNELKETVLFSFRVTFYPLMLIIICTISLSRFFIPFLYGKAFNNAILPFSLLSVECLISSSAWILAQIFNTEGKPGLIVVRQVISIAPLIMVFPFLGESNLIWLLPLSLLLCALVRMLVTIIMFKDLVDVSFVDFLPKMKDFMMILNIINKFF